MTREDIERQHPNRTLTFRVPILNHHWADTVDVSHGNVNLLDHFGLLQWDTREKTPRGTLQKPYANDAACHYNPDLDQGRIPASGLDVQREFGAIRPGLRRGLNDAGANLAVDHFTRPMKLTFPDDKSGGDPIQQVLRQRR
jgi:hypothetical protein